MDCLAPRLSTLKQVMLVGRLEEIQRYGRGRPKADASRSLNGISHRIGLEIERREDLIRKAETEVGCFFLLTNILCEGSAAMGSRDLLEAYKAEDIVQRNFGFLKDDQLPVDLPPEGKS